jgi:hypothetical protein
LLHRRGLDNFEYGFAKFRSILEDMVGNIVVIDGQSSKKEAITASGP